MRVHYTAPAVITAAGAVLLFMDFMDGVDTMDREPNGLWVRGHIVDTVHIVHEPNISV